MKKVFVFDLDGVILDNLDLHLSQFKQFLEAHKICPTKKDFEDINGPNIEEIIKILKRKYSLNYEESYLLEQYNMLMDKTYANSVLSKGVVELFEKLQENDFSLALASSAKQKQISFILDKHEISSFFSFIASGNDVKKAKPAPDIYELVKKCFGEGDYVAMEDSDDGIDSARTAGMKVIFFNSKYRNTNTTFNYEVHSMDEVSKLINYL